MIENKFDKEIRELFETHTEQASPNCWDKVSSQLDAIQHIPDASQGSVASSANSSAFSQFVGSVAGKIVIAIGSVAAMGGLSYLIATQVDVPESSEIKTDIASHIEIPVDNNIKDDTSFVVGQQPESLHKTQQPAIVQNNSVPQEKQPALKVENEHVSPSNSVSENKTVFPTQTIIDQTPEPESRNQPQETGKQQTVAKQEPVKAKQEDKKATEKQETLKEQSVVDMETPKEQTINEPSIDVSKIAISNALTPNGDGHNDYFMIGNIEKFPENNLVVHTRDGKVIYEKANYRNDWNADNVSNGVYYYMFTFTHEGKTFMRRGSFTLIR